MVYFGEKSAKITVFLADFSPKMTKVRPKYVAWGCIQDGVVLFCFVLFLWTPSFEGNWVSLMGFSLTSGAGVDGNAPYQAQELQITTLANPGIQTNFLPPRPVQS